MVDRNMCEKILGRWSKIDTVQTMNHKYCVAGVFLTNLARQATIQRPSSGIGEIKSETKAEYQNATRTF